MPKKRGRPLKNPSKALVKKPMKEKDVASLGKPVEREVKIGIKETPARLSGISVEKDRVAGGEKGRVLPTVCFLCKKDLEDVAPALPCESCFRQAHKKCIEKEAIYVAATKWFCSKCRKRYHPAQCSRCHKEPTESLGGLLMCSACMQLYHLACHDPPILSPPSDTDQPWHCYKCPHRIDMDNVKVTLIGGSKDLKSNVGTSRFKFDKFQAMDDSDEEPEVKPDVNMLDAAMSEQKKPQEVTADKPAITSNSPDEGLRHRPEEAIPEVTDWNITQVVEFFKEKLGEDTGEVFLTQEVDGAALLSMSRQHVISGLGLKLGPALRLLYYIRKIQRNTNLLSKLWQ